MQTPADLKPVSQRHRFDERKLAEYLRRAIVRLPARYREVIVLCDLQDVSYADAAQALGCAIGTVRSRLHRARHLLADKLQRGIACTDMARRPAIKCEA